MPLNKDGLFKKEHRFQLADLALWQPRTYFGRVQVITVMDHNPRKRLKIRTPRANLLQFPVTELTSSTHPQPQSWSEWAVVRRPTTFERSQRRLLLTMVLVLIVRRPVRPIAHSMRTGLRQSVPPSRPGGTPAYPVSSGLTKKACSLTRPGS